MKYIFYFAFGLFTLASCKTSKDYLSRIDEDRTLFDAAKALSRHPGDSDATKALPLLYKQAEIRHLKKINTYSGNKELSRWDKIVDEYSILQKMYSAIGETALGSSLVSPVNYQSTIYDLKQQATEDYYLQATINLDRPGRNDAKTAYTYFKKADKWVPGYKDAKEKMNEAYQHAVINVVINPVQDNSYFFNTGWGNSGYNYSNEYFQQTLIRELGGKNATRYPARFYTEWEARRDNVIPDWVVGLTLRNMDIPRPYTNNYSRNASKQVETGRDTSGHIIYQTVYANINIIRQSFTARVEMEVDITEAVTRKNISYKTYRDEYRWQEEQASYTGDSRALSSSDWDLINNSRFNNEPRKEDVLNELYRRIYPQVKSGISYAVDW